VALPRSLRPRQPYRDSQPAEKPSSPATLTDMLLDTMMEAAEKAKVRGVEDEEIARRVANIDVEPIIEVAYMERTRRLTKDLPPLIQHLRAGRERIARYLDRVWGSPDRLYQAFVYSVCEVGERIAAVERDAKTQALLGLLARASRVADEIRLLAMNGYAAGAEARWRSLHELAVVALVLGKNGLDISERYLAFATVERWKDIEEFQTRAKALQREPCADDDVARWKAEFEAVIDAHGASMSQENGWATPLFPLSKKGRPARVTFVALEALAQRDHLRPFYRLGSHHVHAGSRAAELNTVTHLPDGIVTTTGASVYADITETSHAAMQSVLGIVIELLSYQMESDDEEPTLDNMVSMKALLWLVDKAGGRYAAAAKGARERGLFEH
jgi:hypothetical protein